jgi:hypothetical protein
MLGVGRVSLLFLFGLLLTVPGSGRPAAAASPPPAASQSCSASKVGAVAATFQWQAPGPGAVRQWLDLSLFDNGFAPGTFVGAGPLAGTANSLTWDGILPGFRHFYRLNTLYADGWHASAVGSFSSLACPVGRAQPINVAQGCSSVTPGSIRAAFSWTPAAPPGGVQWLDLSLFNNGFAPGTFISVGPLSAGSSSYVWDGLQVGMTHYWRVNTLLAGGWAPSQTGSFATEVCRPPLKSCIGWLAGMSATGELDCRDIWSGHPDRDLGECVGWLAGYSSSGAVGEQACVDFAQMESDPYLADCILGLAGLSYFGGTSCRLYWEG